MDETSPYKSHTSFTLIVSFPVNIPSTDLSSITPDSIITSLTPAGENRFPITGSKQLIVWKDVSKKILYVSKKISMLPHYLCSFSIDCLVKDNNNMLQFKLIFGLAGFHQYLKYGIQVVAGESVVGRYPTVSHSTKFFLLVLILIPVQLLVFCFSLLKY